MFDYRYELDLQRDERERARVQRARAQRARAAQLRSPSIRRAIGRSIIAIGTRLAAEPPTPPRRRLARSR